MVRRPRLVARIRDAPGAPLALLTAPAGFGKTTVLSEWAAEDERAFAWITLEPQDDDPAVLLAAVARALDEVEPVDPDALAALAVPKPSISRVVLPRLSHSLAGRARPFVLVLDDLHHLSAAKCFLALSVLIDHLPDGSQIALASRIEPALPLGQLRAHRRLIELGPTDLVMNPRESSELLERVGLQLDAADVQTLVRRTEGWPAALYLAALSLRDQADVKGAVTRFAGDDRVMVDYLREEFLSRISRHRLRFLTRSSLLDRLSGPLCDAVLERTGSARLLHNLARANALVVPLDRRDECYRYHALFRDMLRSELRRLEPERKPELHCRASRWYASHGDTDRAVDHAIAAGDASLAGQLIWQTLHAHISRGQNGAVQRWIDELGGEQIAGSARLALIAAHSHLNAGDADLAEHWGSVAARQLRGAKEASEDGSLRAGVTIIRAALAREGVVRMGSDAARAARVQPPDSPWRAVCCLIEGVAASLTGDRGRARGQLGEGARRGSAVAPNIQALCLAQLSLIDMEAGDWQAAEARGAQAMVQVERCGLREYASMSLVYATAALVSARRGKLERARREFQQAVHLLLKLKDFTAWYTAEVRLTLARAALLLDDLADARALHAEASDSLSWVPDATVLAQWLDECSASIDAFLVSAGGGRLELTTAELRILRCLPTHLSFREIAAEQYVSMNTVKTQAQAVYRKLGVSSRAHAVARARELGLLEGRPEVPALVSASAD